MKESSILFHFEDVDFEIANEEKLSKWITDSISKETKQVGIINVIFSSDNYLLELNQKYLKHDTYTDIITFNYVEEDIISGDLFISSERVRENANQLNTSFESELYRVIIHGVLHLIGYNDKSPEEALEIRAKEDFYLTLYS